MRSKLWRTSTSSRFSSPFNRTCRYSLRCCDHCIIGRNTSDYRSITKWSLSAKMQQQRTAVDRKRRWLEKFTETQNDEAIAKFPTEKIAATQSCSPTAEKSASTQSFLPPQPTSTTAASVSVGCQQQQKQNLVENRKIVCESRKYVRENSTPLPAIARPRTLYGLHRNTSTMRSALSLTPTDPGSISPAYVAGFRAAIYAAFNMAAAAEGHPSPANLNFPPPRPTTSFNINSMSDESPSSSANTTPSSELGTLHHPWARFGQQQQQQQQQQYRRKSLDDCRPAPYLMRDTPTSSTAPVVNDLQYQLFLNQVRNVERTLRNAHY